MGRDWDWIKPTLILLVAQYAAATLISRAVGFENVPPTASYTIMALVLSMIAGLVLVLHNLWRLWRADVSRPIIHIATNTDWTITLTYVAGFQLVAVQIAALTWLKEMIPHAIPYWADPLLAEVDRTLLGRDAWQLVPNWSLSWLDVAYTFWAPFKFFALVLMLSIPGSALKSRAMLSYFMTVGLVGVAGEYVLSSGGPIFFDRLVGGRHFEELVQTTREFAPIASKASDYLWASYLVGDSRIGNGISAMPSMHVATTVWAALSLSAFWPWSRWAVWAFALIIFVSSMALGWHYASDGIVGGGGALLCWFVAPRVVAAFRRPTKPETSDRRLHGN